MKNIARLFFIAIYATLNMIVLLELVQYFSIYIGFILITLICSVWIFICFTSHHWLPGAYLSVMKVRKTILEEELWLHPLMHELNLRSGIEPEPQLLVLEKPEMNAFASGPNTIIISRGLLVNLSEQEIKAVLAHEYGHLKNRDTIAGSAFALAGKPLELFYAITTIVFGTAGTGLWKRKSLMIKFITVMSVALAIYLAPDIAVLFAFLFIFMKLFPYFNHLIRIAWCYFCRSYEFEQDRFAQSLGCGKHLKSALLKIDSLDSGSLVSRINQFWLTHPMLYARIRRIEFLEGMRSTL